jgi:hypothetical protein
MDNFLSNHNVSTLYNHIKNDILQRTGFNLDGDAKYHNVLSKLMSTIYQKNNGKSNEYLNNLVIEKSVPFIINSIKKKNNNQIRGQELNKPIQYQDRINIQNNVTNNLNNSNNLSQLMQQRQLNTMNPVDNKISQRPQVQQQNNNVNSKLKDFHVNTNYNKSEINNLLNSLEVLERPQLTNNQNNNTKDLFNKMNEERSYNSMVQDKNDFESQIKKAEETQKMIFQKTQDNKNRKNDISELKARRPELDFDPKQMYMNHANPVDKTVKAPQFNLESRDLSHENIIKETDPDLEGLMNNDWRSKDIKESTKQSLEELYQPEGYIKERSNREYVLLDSGIIANNNDASFKITLVESLIIDKMSDVYLEFMSILSLDDGTASLETFPCFVLSIDELPMNTSSNISNLNNKYIIPNDTYGKSKDEIGEDTGASSATSINVKLKSNYMSTITPQTFNVFNINVYGYSTAGALTLLKGAGSNAGRVIIGLIIKKQ